MGTWAIVSWIEPAIVDMFSMNIMDLISNSKILPIKTGSGQPIYPYWDFKQQNIGCNQQEWTFQQSDSAMTRFWQFAQ